MNDVELKARAEICRSNIGTLMEKLHGQLQIAELILGRTMVTNAVERRDTTFEDVHDIWRALEVDEPLASNGADNE